MKYTLLNDLINLFYPDLCIACKLPLLRNESHLCLHCILGLPITNFHLIEENKIHRLFTGRIPAKNATAYLHFIKNGIVQSILHQLKYQDKPALGVYLGKIAGKDLKRQGFFHQIDYIIPIPLHPKKLKTRKYNQAEKIALGLSMASKLDLENNLLIRSTHNETQTRKSRFNRWLNVESIFEIGNVPIHKFKSKHILIVDDVLTTGSTIEAAAVVLMEKLNVKISIFTLAIA
tara:strand:- start:2932 stop:3627 length:696 start_codon:yes stop_codon:yes gene_type:complete